MFTKNTIDQNQLRQFFFLLVILLLAILLFLKLSNFLPALMGAFTLYILSRRMLFYFTEKRKWNKLLTTLLIILFSIIGILMPIWLLIDMFSSKVSYAIHHSGEMIEAMKILVKNIEYKFGIELLKAENLNKIGEGITSMIPKLLNFTFVTLTTIFFIFFILYFMLINGRELEQAAYEYTPLKDENMLLINKEINNMVISNALGIPLVAVLQGTVGLIGYLIIGVDEPLFWFVATCITSMIPMLGAALAYVPLAIILFAGNHNFQAISVLIYGFAIIGAVDNIFRFMLQKKIANVHPLITVFGIIIGIQLFGFIGLVFGPLLISMFLLLLKIYYNEFIEKRRKLPLNKNVLS